MQRGIQLMRRVSMILVALLALALGGWSHGVPTPAGNYAFLTANASAPGLTIPANFGGLAWNKGPGGFTSGYFTTSDTSLISVMQSLGGSGMLRFGGTPCASSEGAATSQANIQALYNFMQAVSSGWSLTWCLNMAYPTAGTNDIAYAETEVGYIESIFGSGVVTYAIGNEPDLYYGSENAFQSQWNAFYSAVHAMYPAAKFEGPELASSASGGNGWLAAFESAAGSNVFFMTEHFYTGGGITTPGMLLSRLATAIGVSPGVAIAQNDLAAASPKPIRMNETNTIVGSGGTAGISNAAVSAAWVVEEAIALAGNGWQGLDLTGVCYNSNVYSPINASDCTNPTWNALPEWAGAELIWNIGGSRVLPVSQAGSGTYITVLGMLTPGGKTSFLVTNMDAVNTVSIIPRSTASWSTATATIIGSTSPSDLTVNINGVQMSVTTGLCVSACPATTYAPGAAILIPAGGAASILLQ